MVLSVVFMDVVCIQIVDTVNYYQDVKKRRLATCSTLALRLAILWATLSGLAQQPSPPAPDFQDQLLAEVNRVRTQPGAYADGLAARRSAYQNDKTLALPAQPLLQTQEGVSALDEAVSVLRTVSEPLPPLTADEGLAAAAKALADDQARTGGTGHTGSDGSTLAERLARYGQFQGQAGENLAYGPTRAAEVVFSWVVDDGVADRGHRQNLLNPAFRLAGAATAPHPQGGSVCVMAFAQQFETKPGPVAPAATAASSP
jgi:uncharacterized protein YkwD